MKTNGHTPGTWVWDEPANWHGLQARVCTETYAPIAQVQISGWPRKQGLANAALISAAPDLLAACEAALAYIPGSEVRNWPPGWALRAEAIKKLTAAIVLAKGQP